ncbi:MAG: alpha/beta hydrolase [Myxococcus sp.]|nr:alpha/beta hydrolase [Myxococcus sp.]
MRTAGVVEAADGTPIAFHTHGASRGPVVLLTNGIGTTENFWRFLVADLSVDHTVVHWDYRGHGHTPTAASRDYRLRTHADDLGRVTRRVMERDGRPPVHLAFSMGVAVLLELYRTQPELVRAMGLIAGAPDAPGTGVGLFRLPGASAAVRTAAALATPVVPLVAPLVKLFLRSRLPYPVALAAGVLQPGAARADIDQFLAGVAAMDPLAYWHTLRGLLGALGSDVLPRVSVPVHLIAASKDRLMPAAQLEAMRRALPHATFTRIDDAGHAGLVEKGPEMARAVRQLLSSLR